MNTYPKDKLSHLFQVQISSDKIINMILLDLLWERFYKDLKDAKLCPSDTLYYVIGEYGSIEQINEYWFKWLKKRGYINSTKTP